MAWDDAMGYMGLGNIANAYKKQALREQGDLESDLYARGYRGTPTDQIDVKRGALGGLLQSAGILGAPDPEPMTEHQRFIYEQGGRNRQLEDMMLDASKLDLTDKRNLSKLRTLQNAVQALKWTGVQSPELVNPYSDELGNDYLGAVHHYDKDEQYLQSKREAELAYDRLRNQWWGAGKPSTGGTSTDQKDQNLINSWMRGVAGASLMQELKTYVGDPKNTIDPKGKLEKMSNDPAEQKMTIQEYRKFKQRFRDSLLEAGVSPDKVENTLSQLPDFGPLEENPYGVFGNPDQSINQGTMPNESRMGQEDFNNFLGTLGTER